MDIWQVKNFASNGIQTHNFPYRLWPLLGCTLGPQMVATSLYPKRPISSYYSHCFSRQQSND